jgi:hypothetical protein
MINSIQSYNIDKDDDASAWGASLGLGNAMFKEVPVGAPFRFASSEQRFIKTRTGYKQPGIPHEFKTGARTAVFLI